MICQNCGTQNGATAFCIGCGAPLGTSVQTAPSASTYSSAAYSASAGYSTASASADPTAYGAPARRKNPIKLFLILGAAAVVVIALLVLLLNLGNIKARSLAKKTLEARFNYNYSTLLDLVHSGPIDETLEDIDKDRNDFKDYLEDQAEEDEDRAEEYGYSYDYKILGVSAIKGEDLRDLQEYYDDEYDLKVSAAKSVEYEVTSLSHGRKDYSSFGHITVIKIGSKWYVDYDSTNGSNMLGDYVRSQTEEAYDDDDYYY